MQIASSLEQKPDRPPRKVGMNVASLNAYTLSLRSSSQARRESRIQQILTAATFNAVLLYWRQQLLISQEEMTEIFPFEWGSNSHLLPAPPQPCLTPVLTGICSRKITRMFASWFPLQFQQRKKIWQRTSQTVSWNPEKRSYIVEKQTSQCREHFPLWSP